MPLPGWLSADSAIGRRWVVGAFFGLLALLGVGLFRDYGVSWDETNNHLNGLVNLKYVASFLPASSTIRHHPTFAATPDIRDFPDAHHGPVFEMTAVALNYFLTDHDSRSYFLVRHLLVFLVFMGGVWALYRIGTHCFRDWRWGLLTGALLVLSPRFFAEAFYNGKDIVYMACFTLAMYTLLRLLDRPTLRQAILHGLATALAIDIRVQGAQLLLFTVLGFLLAQAPDSRLRPMQWLRIWVLYAGATAAGVVAGWPYLWAHSWPELLAVSSHALRYPWRFTNLYQGQLLTVAELPWHYLPVWMGITIPLPYSGLALVGLLSTVAQWWRRSQLTAPAIVGLWLLGPLCLVMLTHMVIYEGWRHLYYIYPALLLWAVQGARWLWRLSQRPVGQVRVAARLVLGLCAVETAHTAYRMVALHPYQNVYFSFLSGQQAERLFERDYWGLSYRQGLEWILAHDADSVLTVHAPWHYPLYNNSLILLPQARARLRYTPNKTARYFLTGYRWHPQSYQDSVGTEVYSIRAEGIKILSVFRRRP